MNRLHPPVDGDVIDLDTALGQQFLDIAVGQAIARVPRTATTMTSLGNRKPANAEKDGAGGREREDNFTGTTCPIPLTIA